MRHLGWVGALVLAVLFGCAKSERSMSEEPVAADAPATQTAPAAAQALRAPGEPSPAPTPSPRKLIRTVELQLAVKDTEAAARQVETLASSLGGYVADVNAQRVESLMHYRMTLRVPAERLDEAVSALRGLAVRVDREQVSTEDVTDRYIDLAARLRTLQATEAELRELLAESRERQRKVEDVMAIYRELTEIRSQIEQIQGQLNALDKLTALSTLNLSLYPDVAAAPIVRDEWRPSETVRGSARTLVKILRFLADLVIVLGIVVVPVLLLFLPLLWLVRRWRRRRPVSPREDAGPGGGA